MFKIFTLTNNLKHTCKYESKSVISALRDLSLDVRPVYRAHQWWFSLGTLVFIILSVCVCGTFVCHYVLCSLCGKVHLLPSLKRCGLVCLYAITISLVLVLGIKCCINTHYNWHACRYIFLLLSLSYIKSPWSWGSVMAQGIWII